VRVYPLPRTHVCNLLDLFATAPRVPIISITLTQFFFPTLLQLDCEDCTHLINIAKKKIKDVRWSVRLVQHCGRTTYFEQFTKANFQINQS
jgi:hypothetical protein